MAAAKPNAASGTGAPFCWPKVSKLCTPGGRGWHWLEIIHHSRQVSAGLINDRCEGRGVVWGATAMQLCYVVPSQPQADDLVDVAAVLSRWYLVL